MARTIGALKEKATGSSGGRKKSKSRTQSEAQPGDWGYRPPVDPMPIGENVKVDQTERVGGSSTGEDQAPVRPPRGRHKKKMTPNPR